MSAGKFIKRYRSIILMLLFIIIIYSILLYVFRRYDINQQKIHDWINQFGAYSVLALFFVQFIGSMTPVPDAFLTAIGMLLYGPWLGGLIIFTGMFIAGNFHFFVAKKLGKEYIIKKFPESEKLISKINSRNAITKLTYLRMFMIVTFDVASYVAGISNVSYAQFAISFLLGLLPHLVSYGFITFGLFADGSPWAILPGVIIFVGMFFIAKLPRKDKNEFIN